MKRIALILILCLILSPVSLAESTHAEESGVTGAQETVVGASQDIRDSSEQSAPLSPEETREPFAYIHDPRDNPKAMEDIVVNPEAVYGFSPSPDSTRLKEFAGAIDWTNQEQVAEARAIRQAYHDSMSALYRMIEDMLHEGKDVETIARAVSARRNELRLESYNGNPEELEKIRKSNFETYGNEAGPTADWLYEKYGSWQTVLEKALGTNEGMDACLGLYDEYYDYYEIG